MAQYPSVAKRDSLQLIARYIHQYGPLSQPDLARRLGISRAAINVHLANLRKSGLIATVGSDQGSRGRPSDLLAIDRQANGVAVAVIADGQIYVGLAHFDHEVVWQISSTVDEKINNRQFTDLVKQSLETVRLEADSRGMTLRYAAVCMAGKIKPHSGTLKASIHFPNLHDLNLENELRASLGIPVKLLPDSYASSAGTLSHYGDKRINLIEWGYGVGWSCVSSRHPFGMIFHDWLPVAHLRVVPHGRTCYCGGSGCLETEVGGRGILKQWEESGSAPQEVSMAAFQACLEEEDSGAISITENAARRMGRYLSGIIQLSNPDIVMVESIFKGDINRWRDAFMEGLMPELHERQAARLKVDFCHPDAVFRVKGAASLAEKLFFSPDVMEPIYFASGYEVDECSLDKMTFKELLQTPAV